jgi:hypothetical protein
MSGSSSLRLVAATEILLRQIHPDFVDHNGVQSRGFRPTPKDEGELSIYLGSLVSPKCSYLHFTRFLKLPSYGVWAVTGHECDGRNLPAFEQPLPRNPAHGFINFKEKNKNEIEKAAKVLKNFANRRGALFQPRPTTSNPPGFGPVVPRP